MSDAQENSDEMYVDSHGNKWKVRPGKRRIEYDVDDPEEEWTVLTHFPPQRFESADTRSMKRYLTDGESCRLKRAIISHNAPSEFGANLDSKRDFRIECPHCGRSVGVDVNKKGVARIATHVLPDNAPNPHGQRFQWTGDEWEFIDPES